MNQRFSIERLDDIRPDLVADINAALATLAKHIAADTDERVRKLIITITLQPRNDNDIRDVIVGAKIKTQIPDTESPIGVMKAQKDGKLTYNDASPDEPDQGTLDQQGGK